MERIRVSGVATRHDQPVPASPVLPIGFRNCIIGTPAIIEARTAEGSPGS